MFRLRHCERSEAIQAARQPLDCFVAALLAMTTPSWSCAQTLDERTALRQFVQAEHGIDQGVLLRLPHDAAGQLAEFCDDVAGAGERLLAAARRLAGLAFDRTVAETDIDAHLVPRAGAERGDGGIVHDF